MSATVPTEPVTLAQQLAIDAVASLGQVQAAELALRQHLAETTRARANRLADAWLELHRAYGGRAPDAVCDPLEADYHAIRGGAPDAGERWAPSPDDPGAWSLVDREARRRGDGWTR